MVKQPKSNEGKPSGKGEPLRIILAWLFGSMFFIITCFTLTVDEYFTPTALAIIMLLLSIANVGAVFVMSIIHLNKYKEKGLAITALVFASIFLLACVGWIQLLAAG